jgi:hypothetical protein
VRHCYALLRGPLRRAAKDRVIDNPCIDIVLPKLPDMRKTFDEVVDPMSGLDRGDAECGPDVGFPGAGWPDQHRSRRL